MRYVAPERAGRCAFSSKGKCGNLSAIEHAKAREVIRDSASAWKGRRGTIAIRVPSGTCIHPQIPKSQQKVLWNHIGIKAGLMKTSVQHPVPLATLTAMPVA
jgi:hypothetical protein